MYIDMKNPKTFNDFSFDTDKGIYGYDSVGFVMKVLPSISFYCRF